MRDTPLSVGREWVEVRSWGCAAVGWIPRDVLTDMGIDTSPLDERPTQGTVWFTREQSEAIRRHPEWELADPKPITKEAE